MNLIPVIAHNLTNYVLHHVCFYIHMFKPSIDEKYTTLTIEGPVITYQDKNGLTKTVFEYLCFIDSFRFLALSLEKIASYRPKEKTTILDSCFVDYPEPDRDFMYQKGYYPYSYFDDFT